MNLAAFSLRCKTIVIAFAVLITAWGIFSYLTMPRREDPEYTVRTCVVSTAWPGASTERVEELITDKLEEEINTLEGLRWIRSDTVVGLSSVYVELDRDTPGDEVGQMWDLVRSRVARVPMPEPGLTPVVIDDFGQTDVILLCLYQTPISGEDNIREENRYSYREFEIMSDKLRDALKLIEGIAKVEQVGIRHEAVYIEADIGEWSQLALTTHQIQELLDRRNTIATGGTMDTKVGRFSLKPTGDLDTDKELDAFVVGTIGEGESRVPVYLDTLGLKVIRDYEDPPQVITRYTNPKVSENCLIVGFTMKSGASITGLCRQAEKLFYQMRDIDKTLPPDIAIGIPHNQADTVTTKINDFFINVAEAILIVIAVVYLMVGFRSAAVMAANIPIVILGSIGIVTFFDVQLEQIAIASMIIALGMLVDNAVQICDQSRRLQSEGCTPEEAAVKGTSQLAIPILVATLTTVAAFYPFLLGLKGTTLEYLRSLPITLSVTLLFSYLLAMTFCSLLAAWFVRPQKDPNESLSPVVRLLGHIKRKMRPNAPKKEGGFDILKDGYPAIARICIKSRFLVIAISVGCLIIALMLPVGSQFFPRDLRDQFAVEIWLPEGSTIQQTDEAAKQVEDIIRKLSHTTNKHGETVERLRDMCSVVGKGCARWYLGRNPEPTRAYYAELIIKVTDPLFTNDFSQEVRRIAREGSEEMGIEPVIGARVIPRQLVLGPAIEAPIGLRIYGQGFADINIMRRLARDLKTIMAKQPGAWDVFDTWGEPSYQLSVDVDPDRANLAGVTNYAVARTLNMYVSGHQLTTFREGDNLVPVYLRLPPEQRGTIEGLRRAYVEGLHGKVPLDAVASITPQRAPSLIGRRKRNRMIEVRARAEEGYLASDIVKKMFQTEEFKKWEASLPPGYFWEPGGELFESQTNEGDFKMCLLIALLMIILLLIIQYNDVARPILILTTLPMALIGAFPGLVIVGEPFGFMPQLGMLALFGMVVNTAIIYIEFAEILIQEKHDGGATSGPICGLSVHEFRECLVKAGEQRFLPIAMTTLTTIGGLLPLGLFGGPLWKGMSWLMIFGLMVATVLTLIVVPCLYAIFTENFGMKPIRIEEKEDNQTA
jgi:multidrug efflux pump subunit AcrB